MLVATGRDPAEKRETLRRLIRSAEDFKNAIVFCNRKREVAQLHRSLLRHKFNATALHGDMDQSARTAALESFRNGEVKVLVASDVAARLSRARPADCRRDGPQRQVRRQAAVPCVGAVG